MAASFLAQRRQQLRTTGSRFREDHRAMALAIGRLFLQAATARSEGGERVIPNRRSTRDGLMAAIYAQVIAPYYIGSGEEPFAGTRPLSPYAQLLYSGVAGMVRIEAEFQAALVRRLASDPVVVEWLIRPYQPRRALQEMSFEAFTQWVDPRGFRLTERIQRVAVEVRSRVGRFVDYHLGAGTSAPTMVTKVEAFLTTGEKGKTPYGNQGAIAPKVLLQHELVKAGGETVAATSAINPYVRGAQWLLDPAHPKPDRCDLRASGGTEGDGIYPLSALPLYPDHVGCLCHLRAVPVPNPAAVTSALREAIDERTPAADALRGALDPQRVTSEVLTGTLQQTIDQVAAEPLPMAKAPLRKQAPTTQRPVRLFQVDATQQATVDVSVQNVVERAAQRTKLRVDEVESLLTKAMDELTQADIAIQVDSSRVEAILDSGRFKTQFEVAPASSGATYDLDYRRRAEQKGLGVPTDADPQERPVYGYLNVAPSARKRVSDYGDVTFVLSDNVRSRTTVTIGDSLDGFDKSILAGSPINAPTRVSWDHQVSDLLDYARSGDINEFVFSAGYVEAQVGGGVGLGDIKAVLDEKNKITAGQRANLEAQGIRVLQGADAKVTGKLAERTGNVTPKPVAVEKPPPVAVEKPPPVAVEKPVAPEKPPAPVEKPAVATEKPKGGLLARLGLGGAKAPATPEKALFPGKDGTPAADAFYKRLKAGFSAPAPSGAPVSRQQLEQQIGELDTQRQKAAKDLLNYGLKNPKATVKNDEQMRLLNDAHNAVGDLIKEARTQLEQAETARQFNIFDEIAKERGYTRTVAVETDFKPIGVHADAISTIKQMSPVDVKFRYATGNVDRAYAQGNTMVVAYDTKLRTPLHEFGHILEDANDPNGVPYLERSTAFYNSRTKDQKFEHMGEGYGANEFTIPDDWKHRYMGLNYGTRGGRLRSSELVSMGIEELLADPVAFYEADKQHFAYIFEILMGR